MTHHLHTARESARTALLIATAWLVALPQTVLHRVSELDDEGSETTEKAVLTAIGLGLAVALGAAITAVVHKYQAQIR